MGRSRPIPAIVAITLLASGCQVRGPHVDRVHEHGGGPGGQGIYYWLPRTVLTIDADLLRTDKKLTPLGKSVVVGAKGGTDWFDDKKTALSSDAKARVEWVKQAVRVDLSKYFSVVCTPPPPEEAKACPPPAPSATGTPAPTAPAPVPAATGTAAPTIPPVGQLSGATEFEIKAVRVDSRAEPDPDQAFRIEVTGHALEDRSLSVQMSALGLLTSAEGSARDRRLETAAKIIKSGGSVVGAFIRAGAAGAVPGVPGVTDVELNKALLAFHLPAPPPDMPIAVLILALRYWEYQALRDQWLTKNAQQLTDGHRLNVEVLARVLQELDAEMARIQKGFFAVTETAWTLPLERCPTASPASTPCEVVSDLESLELFSFSDELGVYPTGLAAHMAIHPKFKATAAGAGADVLRLSIARTPPSSQFRAVVRTAMDLTGPDPSFHYRVPAQVRVIVDRAASSQPALGGGDRETLASRLLPVAQLGAIASLPARQNGSATEYEVKFYEALGALQSTRIRSEAADAAALVDAVAETTKEVLAAEVDRRKAKKDAEKPAATEVEELTKDRDVLKLQVEIEQLKALLEGLRTPTTTDENESK